MESFYFFQDNHISPRISRLNYLCLVQQNIMQGDADSGEHRKWYLSFPITIRLPLSRKSLSELSNIMKSLFVTFRTFEYYKITFRNILEVRTLRTSQTARRQTKHYTLNNVQDSPRSQTQQSSTFLFQEKGLA